MPKYTNPKDIVAAPDARAYTPQPAAVPADISAASLLNALAAKYAQQSAQNTYVDDLERTNQQRIPIAEQQQEIITALARRKQNLDYGAAAKGYVPQADIMENEGISVPGARKFDAAALDKMITTSAKNRAMAENPASMINPLIGDRNNIPRAPSTINVGGKMFPANNLQPKGDGTYVMRARNPTNNQEYNLIVDSQGNPVGYE